MLVSAIEYEKATRDKQTLEWQINGREAVDEVPENKDPETFEITQAFIPAITGIVALEPQINSFDESGNPIQIDNPALVKAQDDLVAAQAVIDGASQDALDLVQLRANV